jgi:hypothetical protein
MKGDEKIALQYFFNLAHNIFKNNTTGNTTYHYNLLQILHFYEKIEKVFSDTAKIDAMKHYNFLLYVRTLVDISTLLHELSCKKKEQKKSLTFSTYINEWFNELYWKIDRQDYDYNQDI